MPMDWGLGPDGPQEIPPSSRYSIDWGLEGEGRPVPSDRAVTAYEPSILEKIAGGALVGARRHFLLKPVIDRIAGAFPGVSPETLDRMESRLEGSNLAGAFEFVGEFGPDLAAGFGVFGLGRIAAVRALAWAGRTGTGARLLPAAARTAARYSGEAIGDLSTFKKPLLERGAEIVGGAAGLGGYSGAQTLAEGGTLDDAGRAALTTAALVGGSEVALATVFGGHVLSRARSVNVEEAESYLSKSQKVFEAKEGEMTRKINKINERIEKTNATVEQRKELARARLAKASGADPAYSPPEKILKLQVALQKAEERAAKFYDEMLPKWEARVARYEQARQSWRDYRITNPSGAIYTEGKPYNPKDIRLMFSQLALKLVHTPESYRGKLGPSFARIFQQLDTAETMSIIANSRYTADVTRWSETARKALGLSHRQVRKNPKAFGPLFEPWEAPPIAGMTGEEGVRQYMASIGRTAHTDDVLKMFQEIKNSMDRVYMPLAEMGAEPMMTEELLRQMDVVNYLPHLFADLPEEQIMASLAKVLGESKAIRMWDAYSREGLARFSSIDFNRVKAGSLAEKVRAKLPYDPNPFNNIFRYLTATHRRYEFGSRVGLYGELKDPMIATVRAESGQGAATLAGTIIDTTLNQPYYPRAMRQMARMALGTQIMSKLTLGVIPNMSQPINMLMWLGSKTFLKAYMGAVRGVKRDEIMSATALSESLIGGLQRSWGEGRMGPSMVGGGFAERLANAADKAGYWTLSRTGFSAVERWNRKVSGYGAHYMFRDTLAKAFRGKLRGNNLDIARRRFEAMGANLDDIVKGIREGGDEFLASGKFGMTELEAVLKGSTDLRQAEVIGTFKGAQKTQFIPSRLRRPVLWNHPIGRVFTQFKSFALNQGKLIRDEVFAEAARGNLRPLAYFLSFYPIAGEMVGELGSLARGIPRESDGATRIVENYSMVGGIGIFTNMFISARYGKLEESIFGPTFGDFTNVAERLAQGDIAGLWHMLERQPAYQATRSLTSLVVLTVQAIDDYLDEFPAFESEGAETTTAIDFGIARHREIMKKGRPQ